MKVESMMGELFSGGSRPETKYKKLMEMDDSRPVMHQFRWVPMSVFTPDKETYWDDLIGDEGDAQYTRRSSKAKYLPNLRYSKFHPQLAEVIVRYWSEKGSTIVDPFAGRATRGIVSLKLGRYYEGYEIAPKTYEITRKKIEKLGGRLFQADGCLMKKTESNYAHLVFTCPPYHNLEKYESVPGQLSDIPDYFSFLNRIKVCARNMYRVLQSEGFLCWVCGDWRGGGYFKPFHCQSISMFQEAGFILHDIVIVRNHGPFAALQAGKVAAKRITSKVHEYLIVMRKP